MTNMDGHRQKINLEKAETASDMLVMHCSWGTCSSDAPLPLTTSFVKASVLCCLPNQRERLKHAFLGSKPAGVPTASPMLVELHPLFFFFFFLFFSFFFLFLFYLFFLFFFF